MAPCCDPRGCDWFFGSRFARRMARRYRKRGLGGTERRMVEFLLKRGAKANLPGDQPWATPLAWAIRHGRRDIATLLK